MELHGANSIPTTIDLTVVRAEFEKNHAHQTGKTADFDRWLCLFADTSKSMEAIAVEMRCSRETVRRKYQRYCAVAFPDQPNGYARRRALTPKRHRQKALQTPQTETARIIAHAAIVAGLCVEQIMRKGKKGSFFCQKRLLINGHLCDVSDLRHAYVPSQTSKRRYSILHIAKPESLVGLFARVVLQRWDEHQRMFVLPAPLLMTLCAGEPRSFAIPVDLEARPTRRISIIDYREYEGKKGWSLFRTSS